jgi:hypothetical protein
MNIKTSLCFVLVLFSGFFTSKAQVPPAAATPPPLPPGPLIANRAADFAHWMITTTIKNPANATATVESPPAAGKPAVTQITTEVTKTGDIRHISRAVSTGGKSDLWSKGAVQVTIRPEWKQPLLSTGEARYDASRVDFSKSDFEGFDWISKDKYIGQTKLGGKDCIIYKAEVPAYEEDPLEKRARGKAVPGDTEIQKLPAMAYIDLATRLPVALVVGTTSSAYRFEDAPTEKLTLPSEAQGSIDSWLQKKQNMLRKPAQP